MGAFVSGSCFGTLLARNNIAVCSFCIVAQGTGLRIKQGATPRTEHGAASLCQVSETNLGEAKSEDAYESGAPYALMSAFTHCRRTQAIQLEEKEE